MNRWGPRVGAALGVAVIGTLLLWILLVAGAWLVRWLSLTIPAEPMVALATLIFVGTVIGDWAWEEYKRQRDREL